MVMATPPTPAAGGGGGSRGAKTVAAETLAGTRAVMTIDGSCSDIKEALRAGRSIESQRFRAGGHTWYLAYGPANEEEDEEDEDDEDEWVWVSLRLDGAPAANEQVKARYELAVLNQAGETILSYQSSYIFSSTDDYDGIEELRNSAWPGLEDSFQIRCEVTVVNEIAAVQPPELHRHLGGLLANQVGVDVTFDVGGELITAHRCVLAARSAVFMAELYGAGMEKAYAPMHVWVDGVEPRVFRALLHFVYTDSLPEVNEGDDDDKIAMARGLLVAADRYAMERLKLMCGDILSIYIDKRTVVTTLELADKHGCQKLKEACIKFLKDLLAKMAI